MLRSGHFVLLLVALISLSSAKESFDVTRTGRKTQLDGFLMDWMEKNRRDWDGSGQWSWDAINTPEGVAGYFHTKSAPACSSWAFAFDAGLHDPFKVTASTTTDTETAVFCTNRSRQGSQSSLTVEWVLPWDSVSIDGNDTYAITIGGRSVCGDSLEPIFLTGKRYATTSVLPKDFTRQVIEIIVLLILFVYVQFRLRKKSRQRGSPRQSA
jgi:hypothetical protein